MSGIIFWLLWRFWWEYSLGVNEVNNLLKTAATFFGFSGGWSGFFNWLLLILIIIVIIIIWRSSRNKKNQQ